MEMSEYTKVSGLYLFICYTYYSYSMGYRRYINCMSKLPKQLTIKNIFKICLQNKYIYTVYIGHCQLICIVIFFNEGCNAIVNTLSCEFDHLQHTHFMHYFFRIYIATDTLKFRLKKQIYDLVGEKIRT